MHQRKQSNVMILELIIVLLFLTLSATVLIQMFVKAHDQASLSRRTSSALLIVEDWVEQIRASALPEQMLIESGWTLEGGEYTYQAQDGVSLKIVLKESTLERGTLVSMAVSAYAAAGDEPLIELPVERYLPGAGGGA